MSEPALLNHSPYTAQLLPILDVDGWTARVAIVKAGFALGSGVAPLPAPSQPLLRLGDEPWGDARIADIRRPGDLCIAKPGTDVVVCGHAMPAAGAASAVDVGLRVAERAKWLRVHGARQWRRGLRGVVPGAAAPLHEPVPLAWSRAYGGSDFEQPDAPLEEPRNPVGSGIARRPQTLIDRAAPQIEAPGAPILAAASAIDPVGVAALGRHFEPRRALAGTYDARWLRERYPARPHDYQAAHELCAPRDFCFDTPLRGGEPIRLRGLWPRPSIDFLLPKLRISIEAEIGGRIDARRPHLDTVLIDADAGVVELVWRALFRCPEPMRRFAGVVVDAKDYRA